jgi:hypothetical protein
MSAGQARPVPVQPPQTKKTPAVVGTTGVLIRTTAPGIWELGACKTPGVSNFAPSAYLKLYKIAHSKMTMYNSNNSASAVTLSGAGRVSQPAGA